MGYPDVKWTPPQDAVPVESKTIWKPPTDAVPVKKDSGAGSPHDFTHGYKPTAEDLKVKQGWTDLQGGLEKSGGGLESSLGFRKPDIKPMKQVDYSSYIPSKHTQQQEQAVTQYDRSKHKPTTLLNKQQDANFRQNQIPVKGHGLENVIGVERHKNSWDNVDLLPNVVLGGLEKDAAHAAKFLGDKVFGDPQGHLAKDAISNAALKLEGWGQDKENKADQFSLPDTGAGGVVKTATSFVPTVIELALTPELNIAKIGKLGEVLTKYGGKYAPKVVNMAVGKFPVLMGVNGLTGGYTAAKEAGATDYDATKAGLVNSAKEYGKGLLFEGAGAAAGKVSKIGAKFLEDAGWMKGGEIVKGAQKAILHAAAQATAFSAIPIITNAMQGKSTSLDEIRNNAILGGITGLFHGDGKDDTPSDGAAKEIMQRSPLIDLHNFMAADMDGIKMAHALNATPTDLHMIAATHAERAFQESNPEAKAEAISQSSINGKLASVKSVTQAILKDKDAVIASLPDDIDKQPIIDKINEVHKAFDPIEQQKTVLADKIQKLQSEPTTGDIVKDKENKVELQDLNKQLDDIVKKQYEDKKNEQIQPNKEVHAEQSGDGITSPESTINPTNESTENSQIKTTENETTKKGAEDEETGAAEKDGEQGLAAKEEVGKAGDAKAEPETTIADQIKKHFGNVNESTKPEGSKFAGKKEWDATDKNGYKISVKPNQDGYEVFLGKPGKDVGNVNSFNQIESWFPESEKELSKSIDDAKSLIDKIEQKGSLGPGLAKLPVAEHAELNGLLKEDGINISHLKDVNDTQRNESGDQDTQAATNAETVQQPENDGTGNAGKDRPGESPKGGESTKSKTGFKKPDSESTGGKEVKKTILTKRAYEGEVQPEVKKYLEDKGLKRASFSQEERSKQATDFINKFGDEPAYHAVDSGDIDGGLAASVLAQLQIRNSEAIEDLPEDSERRDELAKKHADLIALMEKRGYFSGEFIGQLAHEYQNKDLNFASIKRQVEKLTKKTLTKEQESKIKETVAENERLKTALKDAEAKLIEETDKAFRAGEESVKNETKAQKAKRIADKIRAGKIHRPGIFSNATPASLAWDTAVEVVAKSVEAGGKIADAIELGLEHIRSTSWYKGLSDKKKTEAETTFKRYHNDNSGSADLSDLQSRFADKTDNKFNPSEARDIWGYMKENYLNNGTSYADALSKTSQDLGLSWRQVSEAVVTPKLKRISDEMWKRNSELARNRSAIKNWIGQQESSAPVRAWRKISGLLRGIATFGHGHIFLGTHAGMTFFNPSTWSKTIPAFFRGFKLAYGTEAAYERNMQELKNEPNYLIAQRAGLKNDPDRINVEEFQKSQQYLGRLGHVGERGFNTIKVLRQHLFDYHFNNLSAAERDDPEVAKSIADLVNLATGATTLKLPAWVNEVSFAGGMEAARWEKLLKSPAKSAETLAKVIRGNPTPAEKVFAKVWARRVGEQVATYTSLLAINAAINNYFYPNDKKRLFDPSDPNWWKFKFGKTTIDPTSGMRSTASFLYELSTIPFKSKAENYGKSGLEAEASAAEGYGRGKLAPLYATISDFVDNKDFNRNVMPKFPVKALNFRNDSPTKGHHKLTWIEYGTQKLPLPVAEGLGVFYQSALDHGANKKHLNSVMDGILSGVISGTTGFRVGEYKETKGRMKKTTLDPSMQKNK
jgi:hypothetical protein